MVLPDVHFERKHDLCLSSCLTTIATNNELQILALNLTDHVVTVSKNQPVAKFLILTLDEAESLIPIPAEILTLDKAMKGEVFQGINQLVQCEDKIKVRQPQKPKPDYNNLWFPTPETCDNPEQMTPIPRKIYEQLYHFQQLEQKILNKMKRIGTNFYRNSIRRIRF